VEEKIQRKQIKTEVQIENVRNDVFGVESSKVKVTGQ